MIDDNSPHTLYPPETLHTLNGSHEVNVTEQIASGGQGQVYKAFIGKQQVAVKWCKRRPENVAPGGDWLAV